MSATVRFKDCLEPPCPALLRLGGLGQLLWQIARGTEAQIGKAHPVARSTALVKGGCNSDTIWELEGGAVFDHYKGGGGANPPAACRHMLEIGD